MTEKAQHRVNKALTNQNKRFYRQLTKPAYPAPSLVRLMVLRMGQTRIREQLDAGFRD